MTISEIKKFPTTWTVNSPIHESVLRSYQTLEKVKEWLDKGVCPDIILELIHHIEETE